MTTMNDQYHDGSGHMMCRKCGFCLPCGDCKEYGCMEDKIMTTQIVLDVCVPSELAAGIRGFTDTITVIVDSGDPDGDEAEIAALQRWKAESLEVEASWDCQAVGKAIGVKLGGDIRRNILPYILSLQARIRELEGVLEEAKLIIGKSIVKQAIGGQPC